MGLSCGLSFGQPAFKRDSPPRGKCGNTKGFSESLQVVLVKIHQLVGLYDRHADWVNPNSLDHIARAHLPLFQHAKVKTQPPAGENLTVKSLNIHFDP